MRAQIVEDGVDALTRRIEPALDLVEEIGPVDGGAPRVGRRERAPGGRLEGAEDVAPLASAIVDLLAGAAGGAARLLTRCRHGGPLPRPALRRLPPHLLRADGESSPRRAGWQARV